MVADQTRSGVDFESLVNALYDAALRSDEVSDGWGGGLRLLADAVGGVGPGLSLQRGSCAPDLWSLDITQSRLDEWHGHFESSLRAAVVKGQPPEGTQLASELRDAPAWAEFLEDWAQPQGLTDLLQGLLVSRNRLYGLGIFRERGTRPFASEQIDLMDRLMPHVARSLDLHERMALVVGARDAAATALERLAIGFLLLDWRARVLEVSPAAQAILDQGDGLDVRGRELVASAPGVRTELARLLGALAADAHHSGGFLCVPRPSLHRPLGLVAMRLPRALFEIGGRAATAVVFLSDPEEELRLQEQMVAKLHGLTPAESRVACQLVMRRSPDEIAAELGLAVHTVRNQLKSVLAKTGTRRQGELIGLLLAGLSRLGPL